MASSSAAVRDNGTRQDTFEITFECAGHLFGIWDKKTGGELDSDDIKYYPGAMGQVQSLGGRVTPGNLTIQRLYDRDDDHSSIQLLFNLVGKGACKVSQRPLDLNGIGVGKRILWTGKLKRVAVPDVDSESTSAALIEVEISTDGAPVAQ